MRALLKLKCDDSGRNYALMTSIQAGGFNGGEISTDFTEGAKLGNKIAGDAAKTYLVSDSIGDIWVN
jgi:hypothetical protein